MTAVTRHNSLQLAWDAYDAYLFDIDGTLLHCTDAVHYFAFCSVLEAISGRSLGLEGVTAHGNTDIGIVRDALSLSNVPELAWRPRIAEIRHSMARFVEDRKSDLCANPLPGALQVLAHLRSRGALLGVATGNLERIGRIKLEHCGLLKSFQFGAYSDQFEYRSDVFRGALWQVRGIAGGGARICVVGDTPADVKAAHVNGLEVIAVASGIYTFEQLAAERPECCLRSLEDLAADDLLAGDLSVGA